MGVGGMWPNGVALVSEAWSGLSRPMVAGLIGTAANIGILLLSTVARYKAVTSDDWHWIFFVGAAPIVIGDFSLAADPETPRWLATRHAHAVANTAPQTSILEIFRPPLLWTTVIAILLATVAINGGWGSANWMVPWAADVGKTMDPPNPFLKAQVSQYRSLTGCVSSLLGGWIAAAVGRRRTYFLTSLLILLASQYAFWFVTPRDQSFLLWVAVIGFLSGTYFGFLPLFLPELFPTRVRSTGAGVGFNFGRILTAVSVLTTAMLTEFFQGDYARIGRITSLAFAIGMVVILFAPDTSQKKLDD
jgi:MFS family permease